MATPFEVLRGYYDRNQFVDLIRDPDGLYWLKLRSISRVEQLRRFCQCIGLDCSSAPSRQLLALVYNHRPPVALLEDFIQRLYREERVEREANEDELISQLYQMRFFDWGGLYQNSLEQTIVDSYVKKICNWNELSAAIENELHDSLRGYVQCSWYNHWSSIMIQDIFNDHRAVLPVIGLIKKVDFFIHDFPFDLKVTYFPEGYLQLLRRREGLRPELTDLRAFCRNAHIWFDNSAPSGTLFAELMTKVMEHPSSEAQSFMAEFRATRARLIQQTVRDPTDLKIWLYENQGVRRFDASNRFFLILTDLNHLEESWKLKRNKVLLVETINNHLDAMRPDAMEDLRLSFQWQGETFETYSDVLFVFMR